MTCSNDSSLGVDASKKTIGYRLLSERNIAPLISAGPRQPCAARVLAPMLLILIIHSNIQQHALGRAPTIGKMCDCYGRVLPFPQGI